MAKQFYRLTPAQLDRLVRLGQEMGAAQQAIGKIIRHGYEGHHPKGGPSNRESLERELGGILYAIDRMKANCDVSNYLIEAARTGRPESVTSYIHHQ